MDLEFTFTQEELECIKRNIHKEQGEKSSDYYKLLFDLGAIVLTCADRNFKDIDPFRMFRK